MKFVSSTLFSVVSLSISLVSLAVLSTILYFFFMNWWNTPQMSLVRWAEEIYPLKGEKQYILRKNSEIQYDETNIIPADMFYYLEIPGEAESNKQQMVSGRKIGSTSVDLRMYEGKKLKIEGYHYLGSPLFLLNDSDIPMALRSQNQAVIHIYNVHPIQE